jgi:AbrB family looped-hinge helix DNA binding protein
MHLYTSTVTSKGTVTIPAELRKKFDIKPLDKVSFYMNGGDKIVINKTPSMKEVFGALHNPKARPLSAEEINKSVAKGLFANKR